MTHYNIEVISNVTRSRWFLLIVALKLNRSLVSSLHANIFAGVMTAAKCPLKSPYW